MDADDDDAFVHAAEKRASKLLGHMLHKMAYEFPSEDKGYLFLEGVVIALMDCLAAAVTLAEVDKEWLLDELRNQLDQNEKDADCFEPQQEQEKHHLKIVK